MTYSDLNLQPGSFGDAERSRREKVVRFLIHLICIGMLFILPEMLNSTGKPFRSVPGLKLGVYAKALVFIAVFYINYCFIIGRSFERKRFAWRLIGYNIVVVAGAIFVIWLISKWMQPFWEEAWRIRQEARGIKVEAGSHSHPHGLLFILKNYTRDFVMLVLTIGLSIALKLSDTWVRMSRRSEQLVAMRRQEELNNLKSQLNPHFLFNTLNSIYALIAVSPPQAQDAVHELSGMLRYVLYEEREEVELDAELRFIRSYVALMSLRLPATVKVECSLDADGCWRRPVAPLLFIPLVENAFKHCGRQGGGAFIRISVGVTGGDTVVCVTENTVEASGTPPRGEGGIGLHNLHRRLQLIYGDRASLTTGGDGRMFRTELRLPLK